MSEKEAFPSAYSSFAVSVDSRNAERPSYSTPASESSPGILRQTRPTSVYGYHEKKRSLSPKSQDRFDGGRTAKPGVRFTKDVVHEYTQHEPSPLHHRRSSTAAFIEYIRTHLPESNNRGSLALTPKRALTLFAIVFSATYLAIGLLPFLAGIAGFGSPVTVVIRRSDGYYGNSHIFRGGENLADPHLVGDEHHQYLAHAADGHVGGGEAEAGGHAHVGNARAKQRTLRTSTLAEEATRREIKAARAKAKAEALARVQLLAEQDENDEVEDLSLEVDTSEEAFKAPEDIRRRRPLMPLKKLAHQDKAEIHGRTDAVDTKAEAFDGGAPIDSFPEKQGGLVLEDRLEKLEDMADEVPEQEEAELEGIIAKMRKDALERRLGKIHRAQREAKATHGGEHLPKKVQEAAADDEARLRRPGIVKSRKVSTKEQ